MTFTYEFELIQDEGYVCALPFDFDGATQGIDFVEASVMAADWLRTEVGWRIEHGEPLPPSTCGNDPREDGHVIVVEAEVAC